MPAFLWKTVLHSFRESSPLHRNASALGCGKFKLSDSDGPPEVRVLGMSWQWSLISRGERSNHVMISQLPLLYCFTMNETRGQMEKGEILNRWMRKAELSCMKLCTASFHTGKKKCKPFEVQEQNLNFDISCETKCIGSKMAITPEWSLISALLLSLDLSCECLFPWWQSSRETVRTASISHTGNIWLVQCHSYFWWRHCGLDQLHLFYKGFSKR